MQFEIQDVMAMQDALVDFCRFLTEHRVPQERIFDSRLIVNELVANVLKHTGEIAHVTGEIKDGMIEVTVRSKSRFIPPQESRCSDVFAEHGRGLYLVDRLCSQRRTDENGAIIVTIKW